MTKFFSKFSTLALLCLILVMATGCVTRSQMVTPTSQITEELNPQQIEKAIVTACNKIGWHTKKTDDQTLRATIVVRGKHTIVVDIPYTTEEYSINYVSSINMDAKGNEIHPNYNKWVNNLSRHINENLALIGY